ncbi:two-component system sensor histidine kinase NtrB [Salinigranum sp. GCM10025319]|uniref:two-component system sensor histidine kinase NtrB n=1 Tax=Salinigranum sp. GCM10025319 TaxID=3252687 RepID=UPI00360C1A26
MIDQLTWLWGIGPRSGGSDGVRFLVAVGTGASVDVLSVVTVVLLAAGAAVMAYSTVWTRRLLGSLATDRFRPTWQVLFGLMTFFVLGYLGAIALVTTGRVRALVPVTGAVFFCGAIFVLLVVRTSHRTVDRLAETTRFLDDVLDSMGEALLVVSPDGDIEEANPAATELFARERDDLVGRSVGDLFSERTRPFDDREASLRTAGEATAVTTDGETVPVLFSAAHLSSEGSQGRRVVCVVRDITRRKRRETELQRQNDRLEEFASVVSHDLRNPLAVVQGNLDLARETGDEAHFRTAERALDRIERLVEGLLGLARQGRTVGDARPVSLARVVDSAWRTVETPAATLRRDDDLDTVRGDEERLRQALENLFRNAVTHGGPEVTVTVGRLPDDRGFYVEDDGSGVPTDDRDEVFSYGYSTDDSGTGFGLAIVRTIVEAHGWDVSLAERDAGGARFEIRTAPTTTGTVDAELAA